MPEVDYQSVAPYSILGTPHAETQHLWLLFHGYGQLASRFIRKFSFLDDGRHVIIAPQGPDRFYFDDFRKVGASWTTREHREIHLLNQQRYLDAVWADVTKDLEMNRVRIHGLAFSQGVSVMTRWLSSRKILISTMVLWAGGYPKDVAEDAWHYLPNGSSIYCVVGHQDEYLNAKRVQSEQAIIRARHPDVIFHWFDGGHEIPEPVLRELLEGDM